MMEEMEEQGLPQKKKSGFVPGLLVGILITAAVFLILFFALGKKVRMAADETETKERTIGLSEEAISKITALEGLIELNYLGEIDPEAEENGLYKGLVESLNDPYSEYYTAEEYEDNFTRVTKQYYGIGATLTQDPDTNLVSVVYVYPDTPAERAGLKVGDILFSVDGIEGSSVTLDEYVDQIRGEAGSSIHVVVVREGVDEDLEVDITREEITLPTVQSEMLDDDIGYLYISNFAANTAEEFEEAVEDLTKQGMKAMILDVRYNPGGILSSVVQILDDILPRGTVVYTEDKYGKRTDEVSDDEHVMHLPIAVLINENSASASEILAGAIRDYDYGTLIGTTTYGKGVVQKTFALNDGSAVKLTIEEYFTPDGENINGKGIAPDIELEYEFLGGDEDEYDYSLDNQVQKAVEVLKEQL
ncbi:MAG: S41 family peptidase [Lachnospiraceae bacterium]|nr:S41 family peptidase [Lachnospiraceae bacterium]